MAAGDSQTSICNIALSGLGEEPIGSVFPPDNNKRARFCNLRYDDVRRAVLEGSLWNCAKRRASIGAISPAPAFGYANQFAMPADFIRLYDLPDNPTAKYEMEGHDTYGLVLLTDEGAPLNVRYICDLKDPTKFSPLFVHTFAFELASMIGMPLVQNMNKVQQMLGIMEGKLTAGRLTDAQQDSVQEMDIDVLLRSRT